jgi:hypothetical protein
MDISAKVSHFLKLPKVHSLSNLRAPSAFATVATVAVAKELFGLVTSLAKHHPGAPLFIMCDSATMRIFKDRWTGHVHLNIRWIPTVDTYSHKTRQEMEKEGTWATFQMSKSLVIDEALQHTTDVLFLDADILVTAPFTICSTARLGVSPGYIRASHVRMFGYFNGGMLWTNDRTIPEAWRQAAIHSRFYDQASIEDLVLSYSEPGDVFIWGEEVNLQGWRCLVGSLSFQEITNYMIPCPERATILIRDRPLVCLHTHFGDDKTMHGPNLLFKMKLLEANMIDEIRIIQHMESGSWAQ